MGTDGRLTDEMSGRRGLLLGAASALALSACGGGGSPAAPAGAAGGTGGGNPTEPGAVTWRSPPLLANTAGTSGRFAAALTAAPATAALIAGAATQIWPTTADRPARRSRPGRAIG